MTNEEFKLLSISEAAKLLGIGRRALRSLIQEGRISVQKIGKRYKISKSSLEEFINQQNTIPVISTNTIKQEYSINLMSIDEFIKNKKMETKNGIRI